METVERLTFYDKSTCGTCKKAKAFLESQGIGFDVVDIVKNPPAKEVLEQLIDAQNVKPSLNIRSTLYKTANLGQNLPDKSRAIALMQQDPNLIKRPVILRADGRLYQGFDEASIKAFLQS